MKKILILAALATASATSFAQTTFGQAPATTSNLYGELGYTEMELETDELPGYSSDNDTLTAIVGYKFHPNVSGEVFLGTGTGSQDADFLGTTVSTEIGNSYGLFVKPHMMVADKVELFGRVGYLSTELETSVGGISESERDSSVAYGAGVNYHFTDRFYGQFAYTSFYDEDDATVKGYTLAAGMKF
jgi:opacity protein-like surface antigen